MGEEHGLEFSPADIAIDQNVRATPLPDDIPKIPQSDDVGAAFDVNVAAQLAAEAGIAALEGKQGSTYDALVYAGALALRHLKRFDELHDSANYVREAIDSGKALHYFNNARA